MGMLPPGGSQTSSTRDGPPLDFSALPALTLSFYFGWFTLKIFHTQNHDRVNGRDYINCKKMYCTEIPSIQFDMAYVCNMKYQHRNISSQFAQAVHKVT